MKVPYIIEVFGWCEGVVAIKNVVIGLNPWVCKDRFDALFGICPDNVDTSFGAWEDNSGQIVVIFSSIVPLAQEFKKHLAGNKVARPAGRFPWMKLSNGLQVPLHDVIVGVQRCLGLAQCLHETNGLHISGGKRLKFAGILAVLPEIGQHSFIGVSISACVGFHVVAFVIILIVKEGAIVIRISRSAWCKWQQYLTPGLS